MNQNLDENQNDSSDQSQQFAGQANGRGQNQQAQGFGQGAAIDTIRTSVAGVLDSVVREYEPQIAEFTSNVAHQAVERGVEFAQTAVQRARAQSWLRIGVAAALGVGAVAVLAYEADKLAEGAEAKRAPRIPKH